MSDQLMPKLIMADELRSEGRGKREQRTTVPKPEREKPSRKKRDRWKAAKIV